jgi:hypothetical protein
MCKREGKKQHKLQINFGPNLLIPRNALCGDQLVNSLVLNFVGPSKLFCPNQHLPDKAAKQGDQIGRIFAKWLTVFLLPTMSPQGRHEMS